MRGSTFRSLPGAGFALLGALATAAALAAQAPPASPANATAPGGQEPLYKDLGSYHVAVTTSSPLAQRYFDQGLRLAYGFNQEESVNSFTAATKADPNCAMCWWGIAYVLGPNVNIPMDSSAVRPAWEAVGQAARLAQRATPRERAFIQAVALRYAEHPPADRSSLDRAYANAMGNVAHRFPDDPDAATLYAESLMLLSPWDYWTRDSRPKANTTTIVSTLERGLKRYPDHPGLCHFYIHAVEASSNPGRALPCAERLARLMPGAGHLVHMPSHIYMRIGRYDLATQHNQHAIAVDEHYIQDRHPTGVYPLGYYPHNIHFLWAALTMQGRGEEAIAAARKVAAAVPLEAVKQVPFLEFVVPTPYYALARFGRWEDLLREPAPDTSLRFSRGIWHYTRGLAFVASGQLALAHAQHDSVVAVVLATPPDQMVGLNSAKSILQIAERHLTGMIALSEGKRDNGVRALQAAIRTEDGLRYDEPPPWYLPIRQVLGKVFLDAGQATRAEQLYREDLRQYPENGWSLYGLSQALRKEGKIAQSISTELRYRKAWAKADAKAMVESS
jgi:tetratricopeptide (TPR) repeat protein